MMNYSLSLLFAVLVLTAGAAHAQVGPNQVEQRVQNQDNRIDHGLQSGRLTPGQAANLRGSVNRLRPGE